MKRLPGTRRGKRTGKRANRKYLIVSLIVVLVATVLVMDFPPANKLHHPVLQDSAAWYVTNAAPNSSAWLILEAASAPYLVTTNNTGTIPQYSSLSALNQTKIGTYCAAVNTTESQYHPVCRYCWNCSHTPSLGFVVVVVVSVTVVEFVDVVVMYVVVYSVVLTAAQ